MSVTVDDVLSLLDEMNEQGRIEYADYSQLHDAIAATLDGGECENVRVVEWGTVPVKLDFAEDKSRYAKLFGTPERAARTLADNCDDYNLCGGCSADCESHDCYDALLEWLRGEA